MIPVESIEDAFSIAYHWASSRGKDAAQMTAFAKNFFKEQEGKPFTEEMLETQLQHFSNATGRASEIWSRYASESWAHQTNWTIETVKHLAITNVAGIAGAAALLAGGKLFNEGHLKIAVISFTFGLLMALLDFWLVSNGYLKRAIDLEHRALAVKKSASWSEYVSAESKYIDKGSMWFSTAGYVGWISAISAIAGGLVLGIAIFSTAPVAIVPQQNEAPNTKQVTPPPETSRVRPFQSLPQLHRTAAT